MAADGTISDQESMLFMTLMSDSEFPIPDTQAWLDWLASSEEAVEETDAMSDEERIALWQQGEKKGCSECTGELFNWIVGHPQTPFSRKEEIWNKVLGLHYRDECISGYKYIYKHVDNGNIPIQEDVDENGKETKINSSIMMSNALARERRIH